MAFAKVLIANRGEIACRIARTCRMLGYRTVTVFSDVDARAPHVRAADEAVRIGPAPAAQSYLDIDALIAAAVRAGADAVHPGYGFLSENAAFAEACIKAGLVFIGPPAAAIRQMGNKAAAKQLMIAAGVPCVPGYHGADQTDRVLLQEAQRIGFPVMIKAAAGGGGRGMRRVADPAEFGQALATARSEAANAFGSDALILEKALDGARHVEIQVFSDQQGNVLHFGERECSIQRRHQKIIEEAPSPAVPPALRAQMGDAAVKAARAIDYRSAGTIEFLLTASGAFYFLEMNTRIQVEHPVTEAVTGLDLVAWQLRIAAGEKLPIAQEEVTLAGHAIEARLYAEDPYEDFLPRSGTIVAWQPAEADGVRIDHGLACGQEVSPFYDPLLAKVIGFGASREEARRRLLAALADTTVLGIDTNRTFLIDLLRAPAFIDGETTTDFISRHFATPRRPVPDAPMLALAAVLLFEATCAPGHPTLANWSSTGAAAWPLRLNAGGVSHAATIAPSASGDYHVGLENQLHRIEVHERRPGVVAFSCGGERKTARFALAEGVLHLDVDGVTAVFRETIRETGKAGMAPGGAQLLAPMNGLIVALLAKPGDRVKRGQCLVVLEAMKMQHEVAAARDGTVERIAVKPGDQVAARQLLAVLVQAEASP